MRVISGEYRGTRLDAPEGLSTRPTIDRVKEGIFSSISFRIPGAKVLDLFAGSGQMGIESMSRGAAKCIFIDRDRKAVAVINGNLRRCGIKDGVKVYNTTAEAFLERNRELFDIVFLDPPYSNEILEKIIPAVYDMLEDNGIIIAESELGWALKKEIPGLAEIKKYKYGKVQVTKFQKEIRE